MPLTFPDNTSYMVLSNFIEASNNYTYTDSAQYDVIINGYADVNHDFLIGFADVGTSTLVIKGIESLFKNHYVQTIDVLQGNVHFNDLLISQEGESVTLGPFEFSLAGNNDLDANLIVKDTLTVAGTLGTTSNLSCDSTSTFDNIHASQCHVNGNLEAMGNIATNTASFHDGSVGTLVVTEDSALRGNVLCETDASVNESIVTNGDTTCRSNTTIQLDLNGQDMFTYDVGFSGTDVSNDTNFGEIGGNLRVDENIECNGNVDVCGDMTAYSIDALGDLIATTPSIFANIIVSGSQTIGGNLTCEGDAVAITSYAANNDLFAIQLCALSNLNVASDAIIVSNIDFVSLSNSNYTITICGAYGSNKITTISTSSLQLASDATMMGNLKVNNDLKVANAILLDANAEFSNVSDVLGNLVVTSDGNIYDVSCDGSVTVTNDLTLGADLKVEGNMTVQGTTLFTGATTINSGVNINGPSFVISSPSAFANVHVASSHRARGPSRLAKMCTREDATMTDVCMNSSFFNKGELSILGGHASIGGDLETWGTDMVVSGSYFAQDAMRIGADLVVPPLSSSWFVNGTVRARDVSVAGSDNITYFRGNNNTFANNVIMCDLTASNILTNGLDATSVDITDSKLLANNCVAGGNVEVAANGYGRRPVIYGLMTCSNLSTKNLTTSSLVGGGLVTFSGPGLAARGDVLTNGIVSTSKTDAFLSQNATIFFGDLYVASSPSSRIALHNGSNLTNIEILGSASTSNLVALGDVALHDLDVQRSLVLTTNNMIVSQNVHVARDEICNADARIIGPIVQTSNMLGYGGSFAILGNATLQSSATMVDATASKTLSCGDMHVLGDTNCAQNIAITSGFASEYLSSNDVVHTLGNVVVKTGDVTANGTVQSLVPLVVDRSDGIFAPNVSLGGDNIYAANVVADQLLLVTANLSTGSCTTSDLGVGLQASVCGDFKCQSDAYFQTMQANGPTRIFAPNASSYAGTANVSNDVIVSGGSVLVSGAALTYDAQASDGACSDATVFDVYVAGMCDTTSTCIINDRLMSLGSTSLIGTDTFGANLTLLKDAYLNSGISGQNMTVSDGAAFDVIVTDCNTFVADILPTPGTSNEIECTTCTTGVCNTNSVGLSCDLSIPNSLAANVCSVRGTLTIPTTSSGGGTSSSTTTTIDGNLMWSNVAANITCNLFVVQNADVRCDALVSSDVTVAHQTTVTGTFQLGGNATFDNDAYVHSAADARGTLCASGLGVSGLSYVSGNLLVQTNMSVISDLVAGAAIVNNSVTSCAAFVSSTTTTPVCTTTSAGSAENITMSPTLNNNTCVLTTSDILAPTSHCIFCEGGTTCTTSVLGNLSIVRGNTVLNRVSSSNDVQVAGDITVSLSSNITDSAVVLGGITTAGAIDVGCDTVTVENTLYTMNNTSMFQDGNALHVRNRTNAADVVVAGNLSSNSLVAKLQPCTVGGSVDVVANTLSKTLALARSDFSSNSDAYVFGSATISAGYANISGTVTCTELSAGPTTLTSGDAVISDSVVCNGDASTGSLAISGNLGVAAMVDEGTMVLNTINVYAGSTVNGRTTVGQDITASKACHVAGSLVCNDMYGSSSYDILSDLSVAGASTFDSIVSDSISAQGLLHCKNAASFKSDVLSHGQIVLNNAGSMYLMNGIMQFQDGTTASGARASSLSCQGLMQTADLDVSANSQLNNISIGGLVVNVTMNSQNIAFGAPLSATSLSCKTDLTIVGGSTLSSAFVVGTGLKQALLCQGPSTFGPSTCYGNVKAPVINVASTLNCVSINNPISITAGSMNISSPSGMSNAIVLKMNTVKATRMHASGNFNSPSTLINNAVASIASVDKTLKVANDFSPNTITTSSIRSLKAPLKLTVNTGAATFAGYASIDSLGKTMTINHNDCTIMNKGGDAQTHSVLQWMKNFDTNVYCTVQVVDRTVAIFTGARACAFNNTMGVIRGMNMILHVVDIFNLGDLYTLPNSGIFISSFANAARVQAAIDQGAAYTVASGILRRIVSFYGNYLLLDDSIGSLPNDDIILCSAANPEFISLSSANCYAASDVTSLYGGPNLYVYEYVVNGSVSLPTNTVCGISAVQYVGCIAYVEPNVNGIDTNIYVGSNTQCFVAPGAVNLFVLGKYKVLGNPPLVGFTSSTASYDMDSVNTLFLYYTYSLRDIENCINANSCIPPALYRVVGQNLALTLQVVISPPPDVKYITDGNMYIQDEPVDGTCTVEFVGGVYTVAADSVNALLPTESMYTKYYAYKNPSSFIVTTDNLIYLRKFAQVGRGTFKWPFATLTYYTMPYDTYISSLSVMVTCNGIQTYDKQSSEQDANFVYYMVNQSDFMAEDSILSPDATVTYKYPTFDIGNANLVSILSLIQTGIASTALTAICNASYPVTFPTQVPTCAQFVEGNDWVAALHLVPGFIAGVATPVVTPPAPDLRFNLTLTYNDGTTQVLSGDFATQTSSYRFVGDTDFTNDAVTSFQLETFNSAQVSVQMFVDKDGGESFTWSLVGPTSATVNMGAYGDANDGQVSGVPDPVSGSMWTFTGDLYDVSRWLNNNASLIIVSSP